MRPVVLSLLACFFSVSTAAAPSAPTNLPLPRYVSLKAEKVNLRTGPGSQYPIRWVYKRPGLPIEIVEEFEHWRKVRDKDGEGGWVHKSMLSGKRTAIMQGDGALHQSPDGGSEVAFKAQAGVIGKLLKCEPGWCEMRVEDHEGWTPKTAIWGVYKNEVFD